MVDMCFFSPGALLLCCLNSLRDTPDVMPSRRCNDQGASFINLNEPQSLSFHRSHDNCKTLSVYCSACDKSHIEIFRVVRRSIRSEISRYTKLPPTFPCNPNV